MKKSDAILAKMKALESKIEDAFNKFLESSTAEVKASYAELDKAHAELEEQYKAALRAEALETRQDESEVQREATREEKKTKMSEEVVNFIKNLREAVGGYGTRFSGTIPLEIAKQIQYKRDQIAGVKSYCTVHKFSGEYTVTFEGDDVSVDYVSDTYSEQDATPEGVTLSALDLGGIGKLNNNMIKDAAVDLVGYIATIFGKAFARKEDHEILFGAGYAGDTKKIRGVACDNSAAHKETAAGTDTVTLDEVMKTISALKAYRQGAIVVCSQALVDILHDMVDENGKRYWNPLEDITSIRGCKVVVSDQMPALTTGNVAMIVGNFSYYHIVDRQEMEMQVLDQVYATKGKTGFLCNERIDGNFLPEAFSYLKLA